MAPCTPLYNGGNEVSCAVWGAAPDPEGTLNNKLLPAQKQELWGGKLGTGAGTQDNQMGHGASAHHKASWGQQTWTQMLVLSFLH